ncbi:MAG: urea transporter [Myxococcales bacterium]
MALTAAWGGKWLLELVLRPYARVLFSRDLAVGVLVLAAIGTFPRLGLATLLAVAAAHSLAWLFGLGGLALREGGAACTAILTTLAVGVYAPEGGHLFALVVLGAVFSVLYTASFEAVFGAVALPTHSLPFVAAAWTVHLAARMLPSSEPPFPLTTPLPWIPMGMLESTWLDIPSSLVFLHGSVAGVLVLAALFLHSRIGLLLGVLGGLVSFGMRAWLREGVPWSTLDATAAFNAVLAAVAIGGIWFVPQPSSMVLAAGSSSVACALTYALFPVASSLYLPVLSLPFVVTTHLLLTASRSREQDRRPRSALPAERPEEALASHWMRIRRFGDVAWLPFRLPFRGEWVVSQGHDGAHTHQGLWRHGLDFEGRTPAGLAFLREGKELRDFVCYGLPVLAAGPGTVVEIADGVADNRPGEVNTLENWGNAVVLAHGAGLYSVYAHLQNRSIRPKKGDFVVAGTELGRCGNSGRSPTPHLHFQVQRAIPLGSPTLPADFGDVITRTGETLTLANRVIPAQGEQVRALVRDEAVARSLAFLPGSRYVLEASGRREEARVEVNLWGRRLLRSDQAMLFLDPYDAGLVLVDFHGSRRSLLRYVLLALARVPFDQAPSIEWRDSVARRLLLPGILRPFADLAEVVLPEIGNLEVHYRAYREEGQLHVVGVAEQWKTHTVVLLGKGELTIEIEHKNHRDLIKVREVTS